MSEHYIQSQYLLQKITTDFFNEKSDLIRIKETDYDIDIDAISIDSDESVRTLEQNEFDNEYFYLDSDKELSTVFDLCDKESELLTKFTVHICPYTMNRLSLYPFLQYLLIKEDGEYKFPSFEFQCARNIISSEGEYTSKEIYFQNECTKVLFNHAVPDPERGEDLEYYYKGFVKSKYSENTIYVLFDVEHFTLKPGLTKAGIFEILNTQRILDIPIVKSVNELFVENTSLLSIRDDKDAIVPTPHIMYKCYSETNGEYAIEEDDSDEFISLIDQTITHPVFGDNSLIFVYDSLPNTDIKTFKRFAVFLINPTYTFNEPSANNTTSSSESFSLGNVIPSLMSNITNKKEEGDEEKKEEGEEKEEKEEGEEKEEEEGDEDDNDIYKTSSTIYFPEIIGGKKQVFWIIKTPTHFIEI